MQAFRDQTSPWHPLVVLRCVWSLKYRTADECGHAEYENGDRVEEYHAYEMHEVSTTSYNQTTRGDRDDAPRHAAPTTRNTGLSNSLASCTRNSAKTPLRKIMPQYGIANSKPDCAHISATAMTARGVYATPVEDRMYAPMKQPAKTIWSARTMVKTSLPMSRGSVSEVLVVHAEPETELADGTEPDERGEEKVGV